MGFDKKLAHPRKTRVIASEKIKVDLKAAEALAQLSRVVGFLKLKRLRRKSRRYEYLRRRISLVESRMRYRNKSRLYSQSGG